MSSRSLPSETAARSVAPPSSEAFEQPRYSRRDTLLTMAGVLMVMLLAALDQTIVGTAMPRVIAELEGFNHYTWVTTAYLLSSTVMVPIYGRLSDLFGRKPIFMFGLVVFLLGSGLSGAAQSMNQLIAFRAVQGLGAGALLPIAIAIVGDLFTPRERARWQGVTGAIFGIASVVGPTVGGWLTENTSWRWVFYVNLPIGILALLVLIFLMPTLRGRSKDVRVDYLGAMLLIVSTVPLMLGLSWAGVDYAWGSPQVLGLFALAAVAAVGFIFYEGRLERTGGQPIIEPSLFRNRIFTLSTVITVINSMAMFGSIFFLPLFVQGVLGTSITDSGLIITPLMITLILGSIVSGQLVAALGRYKLIAIVGALISIVGIFLLVQLNLGSTNTDVVIAMVVLGAGMGVGSSLYTLIVQNALPTKIGQATSGLTFFRQIGSSVALAAMGSLMNSAYLPAFQQALPAPVKAAVPAEVLAAFNNPQILLSPEAQTTMRAQFEAFGAQGTSLYTSLLDAVKVGLVQGVHTAFLLSLVLMIVGLIAVFFLQEIELRGRSSRAQAADDGENAPAIASMH